MSPAWLPRLPSLRRTRMDDQEARVDRERVGELLRLSRHLHVAGDHGVASRQSSPAFEAGSYAALAQQQNHHASPVRMRRQVPVPAHEPETAIVIAEGLVRGRRLFRRRCVEAVAMWPGDPKPIHCARNICSSAATRFAAVVVFPLPPFWLTIAMVRIRATRPPGASGAALLPRPRPFRSGSAEVL